MQKPIILLHILFGSSLKWSQPQCFMRFEHKYYDVLNERLQIVLKRLLTRKVLIIFFSCMYFTYKRSRCMKKKNHYYSSQYGSALIASHTTYLKFSLQKTVKKSRKNKVPLKFVRKLLLSKENSGSKCRKKNSICTRRKWMLFYSEKKKKKISKKLNKKKLCFWFLKNKRK